MQQYLLRSSLGTSHTATSYRYSITHVNICNYQGLCTAGLKGKGVNYSLESFEKINCHFWKINIPLHFNENKAQTLLCGTETHITFFCSSTDYCTNKNTVSCATECCFAKILLEYFHDMSNTVHPYKHHSHAQT